METVETTQDASVSSLVGSAIDDGRTLVKQQIELAKSELSHSAKQAAASSGMLIGAAVLAFLGFVFLLVAGAYGLVAAGLPTWAGFLIVAGMLILVGLILGLLGKKRTKQVTGPQRAIAQAQETKAALTTRAPTPGAPALTP